MMRSLSWLAAFGLVVTAGVVHGWLTDRWSLSSEPAASAAKLDGLPMRLGGWKATEEEIIGGEEQALAEVAGYKLRTYGKGGQKAKVLIACGRPGPLSVHTPNICMGGAGYRAEGDQRTVIKYGDGDKFSAEMKVGRFVREAGPAGPVQQRIFWAWSADGNWSTPDNPRLTFFRSPALFKLYVTRDLIGGNEPVDKDPCQELIRLLLEDLHHRLAPAS